MERNKDLFTSLRENMLQSFFNDSFGDIFTSKLLKNKGENLEEETFEVMKGNIRTIIKCKFTKEGYPAGITCESDYIPSEFEEKMNNLQMNLDDALEKEDYLAAADIKKQIDELEGTNKETNKQLEEAK